MTYIGDFTLTLAFFVAAFGIIAFVLGARQKNQSLLESARNSQHLLTVLLTISTAAMVYALVTHNFAIEYVASYSSSDMSMFYTVAALWGGQKGSLLLWVWLLAIFGSTVFWQNRAKNLELMPYVGAVICGTALFFIALLVFGTPAFERLVPPLEEGRGLNPLLRNADMVSHPLTLYLGYVGFTIPFAFALAALITGKLDDQWLLSTRKWTIFSWFFLMLGNLFGAQWAYVELGWGGFWAWDPVENASFMPWLTGTAYLHSVMIQEKRGMLKVWNMILIIITFFLTIFGTFITRSGIISSVHSFGQSVLGPFFFGFLGVSLFVSLYFLFMRLPSLKGRQELDAIISRESSFLFNNLILLASCFAVLWGTLFPLLSEAVRGVKISVGAPYFNKVQIPIGIFLLFLTGVGPLLAWRRTSVESLRRNFTRPLLFGAAVAVISFILGARNLYALMTIFMAFFVLATIAMEFHRGARVLRQKTGQGWAGAVVELTRRNTRRYGGYVIHFGIALMFIGFVGNAFTAHEQAEVVPGDEINVRNYRFVVRDFEDKENDNFASSRARIDVFNGRRLLTTMYPERRLYKASQQPTTEVAIRPRLNEDIYLVFAGMAEDSGRAVIQIYINPLVNWVWIGGAIMVLGTIIALIPSRTPAPAQARRRRKKEAEEYDSVAADD